MAYTPELSLKSSCTLRRIAWALGIPMTQAIERVFEHLPRILDETRSALPAGIRRNVRSVPSGAASHQSTERR
jgi:hypothetical protein